jgi:hypothetical protein
VTSLTRLVAVAPPGDAAVHVTVVSSTGTSSRTHQDLFNYLTAPEVTLSMPRSGPATGGTLVAIHGHFLNGTRRVRFGAAEALRVSVRSSTLVLAVAPRGTGDVAVRVTTRGGASQPAVRASFSYSALIPRTRAAPRDERVAPATRG